MRFLISAGEASGETYGAQLIAALRQHLPDAGYFGVGGQGMRAAGCDTVIEAGDIAMVGLFEVVSHLPRVYREFKRLLCAVDQRKPDAAILIDFPDFNFRLARELHGRGIPVFYYVSPQLWAWRPGRIEFVRLYVTKMLVIFPFEEDWYRHRGVDATYVGHPLAGLPAPAGSRAEFARQYDLDPEKAWIALLPGSRRKEVGMNLAPMMEAAYRLGRGYEFLLPVASTLDAAWVQRALRKERAPVSLTRDARATLAHARAAVVASGTATVEAALLGTPFVMVYRVAPLTWALGRRLVHVRHYGMVNLIAGREIVPELVQSDFNASRVIGALAPLIAEGTARRQMLTDFAAVRKALQAGRQEESAAARAASIVLSTLGPPAVCPGAAKGQN